MAQDLKWLRQRPPGHPTQTGQHGAESPSERAGKEGGDGPKQQADRAGDTTDSSVNVNARNNVDMQKAVRDENNLSADGDGLGGTFGDPAQHIGMANWTTYLDAESGAYYW